jgi:uncharacterized protein (DUF885 family)
VITRRGFTAVAALAGVAAATNAQAGESFKSLYEAEWAWRQSEWPDTDDLSRPFPDHLPDEGPAAQERRLARWRDVRRRLGAIEQGALSDRDKENYAVYAAQIDVLIASQEWREFEKPANSDSAFWSDMPSAARRNLRTEQEYRNYLSYLADIPRYFDQQIDNMKAGLARGFTPPKVTLIGRDRGAAVHAEVRDPAESAYFKPFTAMPAAIAEGRRGQLADQARAVIAGQVLPAYRKLTAFLRETYIPGAREAIACRDLPDGEAYYRAKILEFTTLDWSPDRIHAFGLAEMSKIHGEMASVMAEVKFAGDLPAFLNFLRTDPQFYVKTPQALLDRAAWIAKTFDGKAGDWFGRLPRRRFAIVPVPDEIAPFYTGGRGGPGVYLVNTYDLPSRPLYSLTALTLHESAPGHAFQMPLAAENTDLPAFRRDTYISAYGEGWALYCERLGVEMGMYATPYDRFGMLSYQAWRAARLVVDTGIHALGWSRQQALDYMTANTALAHHEVETEVDRYISWPGQALAYYLGQFTIQQARAKAERALGDRFDIRNFHDAVLELGSVPMAVLTRRIDRFILEGGKSPYAAG